MPQFVCIDLKSFYASVECVARGLDPLNANLVVADLSRTEKTICLAVSPSLKSLGIPGRARLFEVIQKVQRENERRRQLAPQKRLTGESIFGDELTAHPEYAVSYIAAVPQMRRYMNVSAQIYDIYLKYIAPEDILVYSIDEVFIDVTNYLETYRCTAHALAMRMIRDVLAQTGITATAGIGTNMYLAKIAMDIVAKKMPPDKNGVRIAELDELSFRKTLWSHRPLTDFWRIGAGTARRLNAMYIHTMGDLAQFSEYGEDRLFKEFGVNAELLIDHAWGYEPCTMATVKRYQPQNHSVSQGQVLSVPYACEKARLICMEMIDQLSLELVRKRLVTDAVEVVIGYDHTGIPTDYAGTLVRNHYGKIVPKPAHGICRLSQQTASTKLMTAAALRVFAQAVDPALLVRRINVIALNVVPEQLAEPEAPVQYGLFDDVEALERRREQEHVKLQRERQLQEALISLKSRYGKNAVLRGMNFMEGATARERNEQVGGHRA